MKRSISQTRIGVIYLIIVSIFVVIFSAGIFYRDWSTNHAHLDELLITQAKMGLEFDLAIREYVAESVRPFAESHTDKDEFIPETMSTSFVARSIFEKVCEEFPDYIIKFSSDDPRNPANLATTEELEMIEYFNKNPQVKKWSGHITMDGIKYMACFSARRAKESCMRCHGEPEDAPAALIDRYGAIAGFHRPVGQVIALDTIAIPVAKNKATVLAYTIKESIILISGLCFFGGAVYLVLRWLTSRISESQRRTQALNKQLEAHQHELKREKNISDDIIDSLPGIFYMFDKTHLVRWNKNWEKTTGYLPEENVKMNGPDFIAEQDKALIAERITQVFVEGQAEAEAYLQTKKGRKIPYYFTGRKCEIDGTQYLVGLGIDITERKQTENALKQSEERFRLLYEQSPNGYQSLDAEGDFIEINPAWLSLLGYEKEEVIGRSFADFLASGFPELFKENFPCFKAAGEVHAVPFKMVCKDGNCIDVEINGKIGYNPDGSFRQTHCVLHNITERKKNEEKLNKTFTELERFNKLMIGREGRVIEMKKEVNALLAELGREPQYKSVLKGEKVGVSSDISEKEV